MSKPSSNPSPIHQQPIPQSSYWENNIPDDWTFSPAPYPRERSITELFEQQVARTPRAPALRWGSDRMTFQQLNEQANQLAHLLRQRGVDVVVGFVETHGRAETEAQVRDLEVIPRRRIEYRGVVDKSTAAGEPG